MIIITATFVLANPESRPEAVAKAIPLQQATRDGEPGCEAYVFSPDPAEENKVAVYELWEDRDSLHAHFDHENYFNMGSMFGEIGLAGAESKNGESPLVNLSTMKHLAQELISFLRMNKLLKIR